MKKILAYALELVKTVIGCAIFAFGFSMFLEPGGFSAGGISGLSMVLVHVMGFGTVGIVSAIINIPLFLISGIKIGKNSSLDHCWEWLALRCLSTCSPCFLRRR